jgi:hypothetical protein
MPIGLMQRASLGRFWLWAAVGVIAMFATLSFAGPLVWPAVGAGVGLLAARSVSLRRAILAITAGLAGTALTLALGSAWPLVAGLLAGLVLGIVGSRREAVFLTASLAIALAVMVGLREIDITLMIPLAPALLVLAALAAGRPQREAAGAITGAGLALFAVGAPLPGLSLTLAGAMLMLALGLRRRRLAAAVSA